MQIGSLGDIVFEVSDRTVKTLRNLAWSGTARIAEHERHLQKSLVEFCGTDPDEITFDLKLSAYLGVAPMDEINKIVEYKENGIAVVFVLGTQRYGKYQWLIVKYKIKAENFDKSGNLTSADVAVSLKEYVKE